MTKKNRTGRGARFSTADKKMFRALLLERREDILSDVKHLENDSLGKSRKDASGDLSAMPYHMADLATDNYEQEFALSLLQSEDTELRAVGEALQRLEAGTYGVCPECDKPIRKSRLKALPHATMCIECKRLQEERTPSANGG